MIYREALGHVFDASTPFVGNGLWVASLTNPDGYRLNFESPTEVPVGTVFSDQT